MRRIESQISNVKSQITELFENKPEGLEQSFIIQEKIEGQKSKTEDQFLKLVLNLSGDLKARVAADGQSLSLVNKSGASILSYDKLKSWDASGIELTSRMEFDGDELSLVVDDAEAVYPVTIDPTFTQVKKLVASDGAANDTFGFSVAVSGNTAVVSAAFHNSGQGFGGAVYIFERNTGGADNWGEVKRIVATNGIAYDWAGWAVALDGNTVIVGARGVDEPPNDGRGSAFVFVRTNETWTQEAKPLPANCTVEDYFGGAVAISGDTAIVGANQDDVGANANQGAAYIFERNANSWDLVKTIAAADGTAGDFFGNSVAINGNTSIVGANQDDTGANNAQGSAYIYERNTGGANNWGQVKKLIAADGATGDFFGNSVSISGDAAIIGSFGDDVGANADQGSAYIFEQNAGGASNWGQVSKLTTADGSSGDFFGYAVAVSGDNFLVGAYLAQSAFSPFFDQSGLGGSPNGAGYIFRGTAAGPTAASVSIGGRVLTAAGRGIGNARVKITAPNGATRTAITNPFGYYRFNQVAAGETYIFTVKHREYQFAPRIVTVNANISDLNFTAEK